LNPVAGSPRPDVVPVVKRAALMPAHRALWSRFLPVRTSRRGGRSEAIRLLQARRSLRERLALEPWA
jgi:hypothetical protein